MTENVKKPNIKEGLVHIFAKNPVLVLGLVIGQLAAGDTTLQNGVALSVAFFFITTASILFSSFFGKNLPDWLLPVCCAAVSSVMLAPAYFISGTFSATIFDSLGIYPALLAVSTLPIVYSSKFAKDQEPLDALINAIGISLGFAFTAIILGGAREIFGSGSLWGIKIWETGSFPAVKLPFWGFILLGFMAAILNIVRESFKKTEEEEQI